MRWIPKEVFAKLWADRRGKQEGPTIPKVDTSDFDEILSAKIGRNEIENDSISTQESVIPHVRQHDTWDCGVACLLVVQRWLQLPVVEEADENYPTDSTLLAEEHRLREDWLESIGSQSIWTADLVLLLHHLLNDRNLSCSGVSYLFCSKVLHVQRHFSSLEYYRDAFSRDDERITAKFETLRKINASMMTAEDLSISSVARAVSDQMCIAIILVDNAKLGATDPTNATTSPKYAGHYIVLVGTSKKAADLERTNEMDKNFPHWQKTSDLCFVAVNPGVDEKRSVISPSRLEFSWKTDGTDNDVIFLFKSRKHQTGHDMLN